MYEVIQAGERTYYISCPTNIGIYKLSDNDVCIIDSGNSDPAGRRILKILEAHNWNLKMIVNTHAHADHVGGNSFLQKRTGCKIYVPEIDIALAENTILNPTILYGGYPNKDMLDRFFYAAPSKAEVITENNLPEGLEMVTLGGHSLSLAAIKTSDDVWFLGDSVIGEKIIKKYKVQFLYDVKQTLESLERMKEFSGKLFIPSHADATEDIKWLADKNIECINSNADFIKSVCTGIGFEDILKKVMDKNGLQMNISQYLLIGCTVRSYLSYLYNADAIEAKAEDNRLLWYAK